MGIKEKAVIECAEKLLHNTANIYLQNILEDLIRNGDSMEDDDIYIVVKKICEDGYDISNFGLYEIPHGCVFVFTNKSSDKSFDVYLNHFNGGKDYVSVGFVNDDACTQDADNIACAIKKQSST